MKYTEHQVDDAIAASYLWDVTTWAGGVHDPNL
jgi:hypothetical protein